MEPGLIELAVPADRLAGLRERVAKRESIAFESLGSDEDQRAVLRVLIRRGQVETFLDSFESLSERYDQIRMTVYAVEATLPAPAEPEADAGGKDGISGTGI